MNKEYIRRINAVQDYIDKNLDKNLSLEELARVSHFSRFHFSRLFSSLTGETLFHFIQRIRLEKAATRLISETEEAVLNIAMDCGFSNASSFSKSFKKQFGLSPVAWRSNLGQDPRKPGKEDSKTNKENPCRLMHTQYINNIILWRYEMDKKEIKVEVRDVEPMRLAYIRHVGPYAGDSELFGKLYQQLYKWAGPRGYANREGSKCLNIYHDNPEITSDEKLRLSVCMTVPEDCQAEGDVNIMTIPGGKYAIGHFEISPEEYGEAWSFLYGEWMGNSGFEPDDRPNYEMMLNNPADHPEGKHIVDIHIPVKALT